MFILTLPLAFFKLIFQGAQSQEISALKLNLPPLTFSLTIILSKKSLKASPFASAINSVFPVTQAPSKLKSCGPTPTPLNNKSLIFKTLFFDSSLALKFGTTCSSMNTPWALKYILGKSLGSISQLPLRLSNVVACKLKILTLGKSFVKAISILVFSASDSTLARQVSSSRLVKYSSKPLLLISSTAKDDSLSSFLLPGLIRISNGILRILPTPFVVIILS